MSRNFVPDAWGWITTLPPFSQWRANTMSLCICAAAPASAPSQPPSMSLSVVRTPTHLTFSISANYREPISLWMSKPVHLKTKAQQCLDEQDTVQLFVDVVNQVLRYGPDSNTGKPPFRFPGAQHLHGGSFGDAFNITFLSLAFLVCTYEAPRDLRRGCLDALRAQLTGPRCRGAAKTLVRLLGANLEDRWMRTMNLAVTNWIVELRSSLSSRHHVQPLFSYAVQASGLWKVQLYCPVVAMGMEDPAAAATQDERLLFSLTYQQLEGVVQLAYRTVRKENWVDVEVKVDNIRSVVFTCNDFDSFLH
jgi:hypothetical protein